MSVNRVMLIGNLGKDPEVRFTPSGRAVARFPLATSEVWNDAEGQRQERTEWHNIVVWGKQAEIVGQYLTKGRQVYIEGSIRTRQWQDQQGQKRYSTEIVARNVQMLGGRGERTPDDVAATVPNDDAMRDDFGGGPDDDIPF